MSPCVDIAVRKRGVTIVLPCGFNIQSFNLKFVTSIDLRNSNFPTKLKSNLILKITGAMVLLLLVLLQLIKYETLLFMLYLKDLF